MPPLPNTKHQTPHTNIEYDFSMSSAFGTIQIVKYLLINTAALVRELCIIIITWILNNVKADMVTL